jgi:C1A family cysteine protease
MKVLVIFSVVLTASVVAKSIPSEWTIFKEKLNKELEDLAEDSEREKIFEANKEAIERRNKLSEQAKVSFLKALDELNDMTDTEIDRLHIEYKRNIGKAGRNRRSTLIADLPSELDWRKLGAVTSVKHQGQCESCYAFSAVGAIEGQYFFETGELRTFSEQQIVDCSKNHRNKGCEGGSAFSVYQ